MNRIRRVAVAGASSAAAIALIVTAVPSAAQAATSTGTINITNGSLAFVSGWTPTNPTYAVTLNGLDQAPAGVSMPFDVSDATGSGAGWNITATQTTFASGTNYLPNQGTITSAPSATVCDTGATCTVTSGGATITYPYTIPKPAVNGGLAPTATKMFSTAASTGMGNQKLTETVGIGTIPANQLVPSGNPSFTSTWTFSLVSAP